MKLEISLQEKQKIAFKKSLEIPVLFYGGSRGGGKSYLVRAREIYRRLKHPNTKGLILRKTYPELLSNHIRMFFAEYPATFNWYKAGEKAIYYPNGSITEFSHLAGVNDVYLYQGREYEDISIDEITQHDELVFKILRASNRTSNMEFTKNAQVSMLLTGNPGGIGHGWAKRLFIDRLYTENENPNDFDFVQAKVWDNNALMKADPNYVKRLKDLPNDLRRAYLEGDWDVFAGQVFSEFRRDLHVTKPFVPKASYPHYLWLDWGYSGREGHEGAFAGILGALIEVNYLGEKFNRVIVYKEWYGKHKTPQEWAEKIYKETYTKALKRAVGDSAMFNSQTDGSKPIIELMQDKWNELNNGLWVTSERGTRNRIQRVATLHNWLSIAPDKLPYMLICENCQHLIRTLPLLVYDDTNVEDVNTENEDHLYDALTYGLSNIKFLPARIGGIISKEEKNIPKSPIHELDLDVFGTARSEDKKDWRTI